MITLILFYLVVLPVSYLPMWVLYIFSDFLFIIVYNFIPYRKKVVFDNLRRSFPEKSNDEIEKLAVEFYRHFCDLVVESIKGFTISKEEISKRYSFTNVDILNKYFDEGKRIISVGGHVANWEWVTISFPLSTKYQTYGTYHHLTNKKLDALILKSRKRNGMMLISENQISDTLKKTINDKMLIGLIADQSPPKTGNCCKLNFLNQETRFYMGAERYSKKYNTPVVYLAIKKVKRGYYAGTFTPLFDNPAQTEELEITKAFVKMLENHIKDAPAHWLWTHRRWKY